MGLSPLRVDDTAGGFEAEPPAAGTEAFQRSSPLLSSPIESLVARTSTAPQRRSPC